MTQDEMSMSQLDSEMDQSLMDKITEHLPVKDVNGEHVGRVDHLEDGRIKLTRVDAPDGQHHYIEMSDVRSADEVAVYLSKARDELDLG